MQLAQPKTKAKPITVHTGRCHTHQTKKISLRISYVLFKVEPEPDLHTGSGSDPKSTGSGSATLAMRYKADPDTGSTSAFLRIRICIILHADPGEKAAGNEKKCKTHLTWNICTDRTVQYRYVLLFFDRFQ